MAGDVSPVAMFNPYHDSDHYHDHDQSSWSSRCALGQGKPLWMGLPVVRRCQARSSPVIVILVIVIGVNFIVLSSPVIVIVVIVWFSPQILEKRMATLAPRGHRLVSKINLLHFSFYTVCEAIKLRKTCYFFFVLFYSMAQSCLQSIHLTT